jgi:hypothetical protein
LAIRIVTGALTVKGDLVQGLTALLTVFERVKKMLSEWERSCAELKTELSGAVSLEDHASSALEPGTGG